MTFKAIKKTRTMAVRRINIVALRKRSVQMSFMKEELRRNRRHRKRKRRRDLSVVSQRALLSQKVLLSKHLRVKMLTWIRLLLHRSIKLSLAG